jgi:hypothetical protein
MIERAGEFEQLVGAIVTRLFAQASRPPPAGQISLLSVQLAGLVAERGLPRPLGADECGAPGGMSDAETAPLIAQVIAGCDEPLLADLARQLVKACFYPEFKVCRDSFREVTRDGVCRRQQLERVRSRISGTHCVDCPHWIGLAPEAHRDYVRSEWHGSAEAFDAHRDVFLPEDFRELRRWLYQAARLKG